MGDHVAPADQAQQRAIARPAGGSAFGQCVGDQSECMASLLAHFAEGGRLIVAHLAA